MFVRVFLALLALIAIMAFIGWYSKADDRQRNDSVKNILLYGVGIALLLLVITGKIPVLFALISAVIPFYRKIMTFKGLFQLFGRSLGPTKLTTQWLIVQYDFSNKGLDATVIQGEFEGKKLSQLNIEQLALLLEACKQDFQSRTAIHAFMAMRNSHEAPKSNTLNESGALSKQQAYEILGIESNANEEDIKSAHKRLMQKLHPDRGGSNYLAAQINAAKDTLLKP
ncbi:MAG: hypothetical protein ACI9J2_000220 [Saprospiraceae bacterium]|jgi:hypothetical protein